MGFIDRFWGYSKVEASDAESEQNGPLLSEDERLEPPARPTLRYMILLPIAAIIFFVGFSLGILLDFEPQPQLEPEVQTAQSPTRCTNPVVRREWRSLSTMEKDVYIGAVQCLYSLPSEINPNSTLYDDFAWTHIHHGLNCMSHICSKMFFNAT